MQLMEVYLGMKPWDIMIPEDRPEELFVMIRLSNEISEQWHLDSLLSDDKKKAKCN